MKVLTGISALLLLSGPLLATVLDLSTIWQPINLGAHADPSRIPLGPVVIETNHGYGRHPIISVPRPSTFGALHHDKGIELNLNLASAFGIEVIPLDSTNVPHDPVTIKIKDWPIPSYSPYRKDQVVSAVLHCLLGSVYTSAKTPLRIIIEADNPEDAKNLAGFAGAYLSENDKEHRGPTPIPGSHLITDRRGITHVVFADAPPPSAEALRRQPPVLVPFLWRGQDMGSTPPYQYIPVWTGDDWENPGGILGNTIPLFHDLFVAGPPSDPNINDLTRGNRWHGVKYTEKLDETVFAISAYHNPEDAPRDMNKAMCAAMYAAVLTAQPTKQKPLIVMIVTDKQLLEKLSPFAESEGWNFAPRARYRGTALFCELVWDPQRGRLSSGSIPLGTLSRPVHHGPWTLGFSPPIEFVGPVQETSALPNRKNR